ncbi:hypothetical protein PMAYCL1PPCAC_04215 [Pristionchus mayeri]|uniref:Uncharacterized protein n=1 Tax=Pristionchus mayeri TaxID=1317129 RepID=A0AAN4ZBM3_9BILA|nr:hypothetical protein PMAYCL1PPCAC_04215 [Pristionchus mayeri]
MFSLLFLSSSAFTKGPGSNLWSSVWAELSTALREEDEEDDVYLISMGNVNRQRLLYQQEKFVPEIEDKDETRAARFFLWACFWREIEEQWIMSE